MSLSGDLAAGRTESPDPASHATNIYDQEEEWRDEEENDDMDFQPTEEEHDILEYLEEMGSQDDEDEVEGEEDDEEEEEVEEYHDAEDGQDVEIQLNVGSRHGTTTTATLLEAMQTPHGGGGHVQVTRAQLFRLLGQVGLRRQVYTNTGDDDDEDGLAGYGNLFGRRRQRPKPASELPPVPSLVGRELMDSGTFGSNEYYQDILRQRRQKLSRRLMCRELGIGQNQVKKDNRLISQGMIPSTTADTIIHYDNRCYSGQFSEDGNFFFSCGQDFKVRMYDTSNPYDWKYYKTVSYLFGQWTITDASLSPDNKYLAYSSIRSTVCLAATDPSDTSEPWMLDFTDMAGRGQRQGHRGISQFGIWSLRFSGDGREIVAGTNNHSVYVYDIESNKSILKIAAHSGDVNAVCFGDQSSPHILYSGSDDTLIKVWDRRSMGDNREAGVFMGHTEGLTYVDSKGDGRYILSNGKDQTMKLWDLRKMMSTEKADEINPEQYTSNFDYRYPLTPDDTYTAHPHDCSLVTYRGHSVLQTLIRCHFSPPNSTNSRYVYSGSSDGSVHIYNMDATSVARIDVGKATHHSRPRDPDLYSNEWDTDDPRSRGSWKTCVRDASWHPNAPIIAATSFNGWGGSTGTCTVHSWNDGNEEDDAEPKMGRRVDHKLEDSRALNAERAANPARTRTRGRWAATPFRDDDD